MPAWFTCTMNSAQVDAYQTSPTVSVGLTDVGGSFGNTAFTVPDQAKREMLAVALAAISTQAKVYALLDPPAAGTPWNCYTLRIMTG